MAPLIYEATHKETLFTKLIQCSFCDEKFHQKHDFIDHMRIHIGKFICAYSRHLSIVIIYTSFIECDKEASDEIYVSKLKLKC